MSSQTPSEIETVSHNQLRTALPFPTELVQQVASYLIKSHSFRSLANFAGSCRSHQDSVHKQLHQTAFFGTEPHAKALVESLLSSDEEIQSRWEKNIKTVILHRLPPLEACQSMLESLSRSGHKHFVRGKYNVQMTSSFNANLMEMKRDPHLIEEPDRRRFCNDIYRDLVTALVGEPALACSDNRICPQNHRIRYFTTCDNYIGAIEDIYNPEIFGEHAYQHGSLAAPSCERYSKHSKLTVFTRTVFLHEDDLLWPHEPDVRADGIIDNEHSDNDRKSFFRQFARSWMIYYDISPKYRLNWQLMGDQHTEIAADNVDDREANLTIVLSSVPDTWVTDFQEEFQSCLEFDRSFHKIDRQTQLSRPSRWIRIMSGKDSPSCPVCSNM